MMFYVANEDGTAAGPLSVGAVRRLMEAGQMTWETPVCVHGTEDWIPASTFADVLEERPAPQKGMACAQCGAPDVQKLRVIWEGGTTHAVSRGSFGAFASDGEGGMMPIIGGGTQRTTQVSALAARCAPPAKNDYVEKYSMLPFLVGCLALLMGLFCLAIGQGAFGFGLLIVGMLGIVMAIVDPIGTKKRKQQALYYQRALNEWERRYFCHRCGQISEPVKRVD